MIDAHWELDDAAAITIARDSTLDPIDMAKADPNPGRGTPLWLHVVIHTAMASVNSTAKLVVSLEDSADNSTWLDTEVKTDELLVTTLVARLEIINMPLPATLQRYLKLKYTLPAENFIAGAVNAWVDLHAHQGY